MIKLIINADDYGMNSNCTRAITACLEKGWITNTSLMVNMPSTEEAVALARGRGLLDHIGLHLNFTEGYPLSERIRDNREFCDESGRFNWGFRASYKVCVRPLSAQSKRDLAEETRAQVERYLALGLPIRHFDSHHHSHLVFRVIPTIFSVLKEYGFKSVRRPPNLATHQKLKSKIYYPLNERLKQWRMSPYGFCRTDFMGPLADLRKRFPKLPQDCTIDLMVHPMYLKDGQLDDSGVMSDSGLRPMAETVGFVQSLGGQVVKQTYKAVQSE